MNDNEDRYGSKTESINMYISIHKTNTYVKLSSTLHFTKIGYKFIRKFTNLKYNICKITSNFSRY